MISWIQHHLIRHGRWIFITLLVIVVVAFVFTIGNTPGCTTNRSNYVANSFYGYDLNSPRDQQALGQKTSLSQMLATGRPVQNERQFSQLLPQRIALLHLADQIGLPAPSAETLGEYLRSRPAFLGPDGEFSVDAFTRFSDNIDSNPEMPDNIMATVLEEDYRIEQIRSVMGGPGFVLPDEVRLQTERNKTLYKLATASLQYDAFKPQIAEEADALQAYYEENKATYEIPERLQSSLAVFLTANYFDAGAVAEDAALREHFISNRARFVADYEAANPQPEGNGEETDTPAEKPAVTFEQVKDAVAADYKQNQSERAANEAAQSFAFALYDQAIERDTDAFKALLSNNGITLKAVEPYTLEQAGARALPAEMLKEAFSLGANRYYTSVFPVEGGFGLLFTDGRIAPEIPPFEQVSARVSEEFKKERKRELFNAEGQRLKDALEAGLGEGKSFAEAAEALGLESTDYEAFEYGEPPSGLDRSVLEQAGNLDKDSLSEMITTRNQTGLFVYLMDKTPPEIAPDDEDYTTAEEWLESYSAYIGGTYLTGELIERGSPQQD